MDIKDYYALLDLPAEFTPEELRTAYKSAMRRVHPDVAGDSPETNALAVAVNDAYQTFSYHSKRWDYDNAHPEYRLAAERRHGRPAVQDFGWDTAGAGRFGKEDDDPIPDGDNGFRVAPQDAFGVMESIDDPYNPRRKPGNPLTVFYGANISIICALLTTGLNKGGRGAALCAAFTFFFWLCCKKGMGVPWRIVIGCIITALNVWIIFLCAGQSA